MTIPSNLYAEKIYSEHPIALWALDENIDYINFITDTVNVGETGDIWEPFTTPRKTNVNTFVQNSQITALLSSEIPLSPMHLANQTNDNQYLVNYFDCQPNSTVYLETKPIISVSNLPRPVDESICIGMYYYSISSNYQYFKFGITYIDPESGEKEYITTTLTDPKSDEWVFVSQTFRIPEITSVDMSIFIEVKTTTGSINPSDYRFYFHGLSLSQNSEEFCSYSEGLKLNKSNSGFIDSLPSNIHQFVSQPVITCGSYGNERPLNTVDVYNAKQTAFVSYTGYNCKSTGIPLVYGSKGSLRLKPYYENRPNLIVPGNGFLNSTGIYNDYTLEFWTSIDYVGAGQNKLARIVGPIESDDGIYIDNNFIVLKIDKYFDSFFVGEWNRPMLIHFRYSKSDASLLINGEQVISMTFDSSQFNFPDETDEYGKSYDYLGFYTPYNHQESKQLVRSMDVDCVAIYSYKVPEIVAKRRYVYAQGVPSSENILSSFSGTSVEIDYSFAQYSADYNYPDMTSWSQASFENIDTSGKFLKTPKYSLPSLYYTKNQSDGWSINIDEFSKPNAWPINNEDYCFRTNSDFSERNVYLLFESLNFLSKDIDVIYGTFVVEYESHLHSTPSTLFKIKNKLNNNYFKISLTNNKKIQYELTVNNNTTLIKQEDFIIGTKFTAGIKISDLKKSSYDTQLFFNNLNNLSLYVGGEEEYSKKYIGLIKKIALGTTTNSQGIVPDSNGIIGPTGLGNGTLDEHNTSYIIVPKYQYGICFLDILVSGYWEDYIPLSYLSSFIEGEDGNKYYGLDFIQFNVDIPDAIIETESLTSLYNWTYDEFNTNFSIPTQIAYDLLDNSNYTNWNNYNDLKTKSKYSLYYDLTKQNIKSYITFQYVSKGSLIQNKYTGTILLQGNKVIDLTAPEHQNSWKTKRFEILDNTIVYPPNNINLDDLAIVYKIEFNSVSTYNKQTVIRKLQLASQALSHNNFERIGTKHGTYIYPYVKNNLYYDYQAKNPFVIYKDSSKYLNLTNSSGIEIRNLDLIPKTRGIAVPINSNASDDFILSSLQLWLKPNVFNFSATPLPIFELEYGSSKVVFYCVANSSSGLRGRIFAIKYTSGEISISEMFTDLKFYQNGNYSSIPTISKNEWVALGISFDKNINLSNLTGSINLLGTEYVFNNIAYYQATNLDIAQSRTYRSWNKVKHGPNPLNPSEDIDFNWEYWQTRTWLQAYIESTKDIYRINPEDIYKAYMGTNKIIVGDSDQGLSIQPWMLKIYNDIIWQTYNANAV